MTTIEGRLAIDRLKRRLKPQLEHAELGANGVVRCVPGRARRSTAAAWEERVFIALCGAIARMRTKHHGAGGGGAKVCPR